LNQNEGFISPEKKTLLWFVNISRWILIILTFISLLLLKYKYLIEVETIIPASNLIIPAIIIIYNILLTFLSMEVKNATMGWVLIILEIINSASLMFLYGTQFSYLVLIIPIMEAALFLESVTFIIIILLGIGIFLAGIKEIVIVMDKVLLHSTNLPGVITEEAKGYFKKFMISYMFRDVIFSITITGLMTWIFHEIIKEGKTKEKERKRSLQQRQLDQDEINQVNDKLTQAYREQDKLNAQIMKLEEEAEKSQEELKYQNSLTDVINIIASSKSPEEALEKTVRNIEKVVPCQTCCIYIGQDIGGGEEEFMPVKISSPFTDMLRDTGFLPGEGIIGWVVATGQKALMKNGTFTPPGDRQNILSLLEPEPSALAVPVKSQNRVRGVIYISHPTPNAIDEESVEILTSISTVIAGIIGPAVPESAKIDGQIKETEARFRQKEQEMSNLIGSMQNIIESNQRIFETLDVKGTVNRIVSTVTNVVVCQTCVVFLEKRKDGEIYLEAAGVSSRYSDFFKNYIITPAEEIIGYVYRTGKSVIIRDGTYRSQDQKEVAEYNVLLKYERSAMVVPLATKEKRAGVIYVSRPEIDAYTGQDQEILSIIARSSMLAINNASIYQKSVTLAITDEITGLENRIYFERRLEEELARSRRFDFGFAIALIDIDQFSRFNNLYGKEVGDHLLKEAGSLLASYCREADCITRLENDLFGIILLHINKNDAVMTTERLRTFIEARTFGADLGEAIQLTVSMGVSVYPDDGEEKDVLLDQALVSLEEAQQSGGNKTYFMG